MSIRIVKTISFLQLGRKGVKKWAQDIVLYGNPLFPFDTYMCYFVHVLPETAFLAPGRQSILQHGTECALYVIGLMICILAFPPEINAYTYFYLFVANAIIISEGKNVNDAGVLSELIQKLKKELATGNASWLISI